MLESPDGKSPRKCRKDQRKIKRRREEGAYRFGEFALYPSERTLERRPRPVQLSPKVFDALLLIRAKRRAPRPAGRARRSAVARHLRHRRQPHQRHRQPTEVLGHDAIQTVSKFGYRFCLPVLGEPGVDQTNYTKVSRGQGAGQGALAGIDGACARPVRVVRGQGSAVCICLGVAGTLSAIPRQVQRTPSANMELAEATLKRALPSTRIWRARTISIPSCRSTSDNRRR